MIAKRYTLLLATVMATPIVARADKDFDERFIRETGESIHAENDLSRLARENSHSEGVKHYAEMTVGAQDKLLEELQDIAQRHHYKIPESMSAKQRESYDRLKDLRSEEFDLQYMQGQVDDQKSLVDLFDKARHDCDEKNLREFADRKIDLLKQHEQNAEELYRKIKRKEDK